MPAGTARRMFLLEYGAELVPKFVSVRGDHDGLAWEPVVGILVETDEGWVVLDTGFSRAMLDDEAACAAVYTPAARPHEYRPPRGLPGEPFAAALAQVGVAVEDLALAVVSHLHIDHSGGLPLLGRAGVPVIVQRRELEFSEGAGLELAYYRPDYIDRGVDWRVVDGDVDIATGISAVLTPGHTPGHMSYRIDLPQTGTWLFTMDAADLGQNLFDRAPIGTCADPADEPRVLESLDRLLELGEELDARVVPCHDPFFWRAVRHPPGGHL